MSRRIVTMRTDKPSGSSNRAEHEEHLLSDDGSIQDDQQPHEKTGDEIAAEKRKSTLLAVSFVLMLIFGLGNKATQVLQLDYIGNYPLFLSLITTAVYIPASFAYILPMIKWGTAITPEQRAIPMKTWILIGALDSVAGIMQILTINIIKNGTLIVLLSQTAIPISMICSKFFLGAKYTVAQYIGVSVVIGGLLVVLLPRFLKPGEKDDDTPSTVKLIIAILVFITANFPMCLSTVYKELSLGDTDVDAMYLNGWVAVWQLIISFPLLIPSSFAENVPIKKLPQNLYEGAKCFFGKNSYTAPNATVTTDLTADPMLVLGAAFYATQGIIAASSQLREIQLSMQKNNDIIQQQNESLEVEIVPTTTTITEYITTDFHTLSTPFMATLSTQEVIHTLDENGEIIATKVQPKQMLRDERKTDDCGKAPIYTSLYMAFNIVYNILIILLIKYGSANILFLCLTITLPLSSVFFALKLPFIKKPKPFSVWDIIGLIVLLTGLVIYRFWAPISLLIWPKKATDSAEDEQDGNNINNDDNNKNPSTSIDDLAPRTQQQGTINSDYQYSTQPIMKSEPVPSYYGDVNANVDDPFGDHEQEDHDGYAVAETAPTLTNSSSNASDVNSHGRKKVKKGRK